MGKVNRYIDHACLGQEATEEAILHACRESIDNDFFALAVNPVWVSTAASALRDSSTKSLAVVGFPLGANRTDIKVAEAAKAAADGAAEIDMVANIGWLLSGELKRAETEIHAVREALPFSVLLKVIVEANRLDERLMSDATRAVINGGAQFIKTGTGLFGGCTVGQVQVLYRTAGAEIKVKASGGIKTAAQCVALIRAGATRLGTSSGVGIVQEAAALKLDL